MSAVTSVWQRLRRGELPPWVYTALATVYFKPAILDVIPLRPFEILESTYNILRVAAAAAALLLALSRLRRRTYRPSWALLWLFLYLAAVWISSAIHANNLRYVTIYCITIFSFCLLLELAIAQDPAAALNMLVRPMTVLIVLNLGLLLIFPGGIVRGGTYSYTYNLLGIDNFLAPLLVPYMFLVCLRSVKRSGHIDVFAYTMLIVCALSLLLVWSATGLIGMAAALLYLLFFFDRRRERIAAGWTAPLFSALGFFGIVIGRMQNLFRVFIEDVLHKGLSFTGRTDIWDKALERISASPWLGWGVAQSGKVYRLVKGKYYHAHNVILEVTMEGGLAALLPWLGMLTVAGTQLILHRKSACTRLLSAGLAVCALMTIMEPFLDTNGLLIYALIICAYHVGSLTAGKWTDPAGPAQLQTIPNLAKGSAASQSINET